MNEFINPAALKRKALIVDDEIINRTILGHILSGSYDVTYAENGQEAYDMLTEQSYGFSLILLDLIMPVMDGFTFLEKRKEDEALRRIPVIVMTSEKSAEVKSIRLGASDFITKPFEMPEVIIARCERIVELSENTSIIRSTKNDSMTGLYAKEFFYEYLHQYASLMEGSLDAVVLNIDRFHLINELSGRRAGNRILKLVADLIKEVLLRQDGVACRAEADNFLVCLLHREDYGDVFIRLQEALAERSGSPHIHIRAGIYQNVDREVPGELWFDRAKIACDRIRGDFMRQADFYSESLHTRALFHERLINDVQEAIDKHHLTVFYQPKYKIQGSEPRLSSAEALVRWQHPELGMISPGEFIPLFESNGLIQKLDNFVWNEAALQVRRWKDRFGVAVPVSVNVSRVDIYDPELENKLIGILGAAGLTPDDFMLEITETAYADNGARLVEVVEHMRGQGFKIEMDDFGTGYSSLNMLTSIPIDVLKMDMKFIRNMLRDEKSLRLVELIMDIAKFLDVPVVAEGVEEEAQLNTLRQMGCECIQGYYFSKPVPPEDFEVFIREDVVKGECATA